MSSETRAHLPVRHVLAVGAGNALEFYDFLTFSFFAVQIGKCFFPSSTPKHGLLFTLATFGVGFLARPLGGIFIGRYGDRAGRRPAMLLSFTLMGFGVIGLACTPPFARIGMAAPLLLVMFRLIQGFALGGEVGPTTAFLIESAPPGRRGLATSVQFATQFVAVLAAGFIGFGLAKVLPPDALTDWGWRAAFLAGATILPFGLAMRRRLPETVGMPNLQGTLEPAAQLSVRLVCISLAIIGASTISVYSLNYMAVYAQDTLHMPATLAFGCVIVQGVTGFLATLLAGAICDRFGRKRLLLTGVTLQVLVLIPAFMAMTATRTPPTIYAAVALLCIAQCMTNVPGIVLITESLPKHKRSGSLAILYATALALFGGTTQFAVKALLDATGNPLVPAYYVTGALVIGAIAMVMIRDTVPKGALLLLREAPGSV